MQLIPTFSIPMYQFTWDQHREHQSALISRCEQHRAQQRTSGVAPSIKQGLYESDFDLFRDADTSIQALMEWCRSSVFEAARDANGGRWSAGARIGIDIHESWCHITQQGGYHDMHWHPNSSWSGIYYVSAGECDLESRSGVNRFYAPYAPAYSDLGTLWSAYTSSIDIPAQDGALILFPSWIQHSAMPYLGKAERVVIAFNCKFIDGGVNV